MEFLSIHEGDALEMRTFQSLADELGVSKERVRQLENRATKKLRDAASEMGAMDLFHADIP